MMISPPAAIRHQAITSEMPPGSMSGGDAIDAATAKPVAQTGIPEMSLKSTVRTRPALRPHFEEKAEVKALSRLEANPMSNRTRNVGISLAWAGNPRSS
jgi:hypothetical protein